MALLRDIKPGALSRSLANEREALTEQPLAIWLDGVGSSYRQNTATFANTLRPVIVPLFIPAPFTLFSYGIAVSALGGATATSASAALYRADSFSNRHTPVLRRVDEGVGAITYFSATGLVKVRLRAPRPAPLPAGLYFVAINVNQTGGPLTLHRANNAAGTVGVFARQMVTARANVSDWPGTIAWATDTAATATIYVVGLLNELGDTMVSSA